MLARSRYALISVIWLAGDGCCFAFCGSLLRYALFCVLARMRSMLILFYGLARASCWLLSLGLSCAPSQAPAIQTAQAKGNLRDPGNE